ncbi:hypothetical protein CASFOL_021437 [Castilleja foliolosa]|uniref:Uncharacterized protein n=1 Tax=Castilleja foliolosa TaxID=1961234 RepID=A0ABD3CXE3_9LAMI
MMERKLALLRSQYNPISVGPSSSSVLGFESPSMLPVLGTGGEEERIILSLAEKERLRKGHESGGFGTRVSDVRPAVSERPKEKRKIILLDKPDEDIAGLNRKASTPLVGLDSSESPAKDGFVLFANSVLRAQRSGKKHKSKEVTLRAQRSGKNYSMGLFPKNATKSIEAHVTPDSSSTSGSPQPLLLTENDNSDNLKKDHCVEQKKEDQDQEKDQHVVPEAQKKEESKKNRFRFWCEMWQVGSNAKKIFNTHKNGKKHAKRLEAGSHNAFNDREKIVVLVNREGVVIDRDGKNMISVDVDEALGEAGQENHDLVDENKEGDVSLECAVPADDDK